MLGLDLACFELAHVEHIVDELKQEIRGRKNFGEAVLHPRGIGDIFFGNLRHAADAVERRADIVTHTAQKIGLCGVGHRGLLGGLAQALLVVDLLLLLRGDVARKQHDSRDLTGLTAALQKSRKASRSLGTMMWVVMASSISSAFSMPSVTEWA